MMRRRAGVFACAALPALGELVEDPETGLLTGTITVNGQTHTIESNARLSGADLTAAILERVRSGSITGTP